MSYQNLIQKIIGVTLVILHLVGCGTPEMRATSVQTNTPLIPTSSTWLLQGQINRTFTSVCDLGQPELQPQKVEGAFAAGVRLTTTGCLTLDEELQSPIAVIIRLQNSTNTSQTLTIPSPSDVIIHTQVESKQALAIYIQGWLTEVEEGVKLQVYVEPGEAVDLLYLLDRFSGEASIEVVNIGSFKSEEPPNTPTQPPSPNAVKDIFMSTQRWTPQDGVPPVVENFPQGTITVYLYFSLDCSNADRIDFKLLDSSDNLIHEISICSFLEVNEETEGSLGFCIPTCPSDEAWLTGSYFIKVFVDGELERTVDWVVE